MRDSGGGSTRLCHDPLLDSFFDVILRTHFQHLPVFSPKASLDGIEMFPKGVELLKCDSVSHDL